MSFSATAELFNDGGAFEGLKAGDFPNAPIGNARDSWVTLGFDAFGGGDIDYSPEFAGAPTASQVVQGSSWSETNGGWFDPDPGTPVSGEQVLIAQFTLAEGADFTLSGLANWQTGDPEGFISSAFSVTTIPAPATLALLGIAGLVGRRRR